MLANNDEEWVCTAAADCTDVCEADVASSVGNGDTLISKLNIADGTDSEDIDGIDVSVTAATNDACSMVVEIDWPASLAVVDPADEFAKSPLRGNALSKLTAVARAAPAGIQDLEPNIGPFRN